MSPDPFPNWAQSGYEWFYEEIYGADFFTLTKAMEDGSFLTLFPYYFLITQKKLDSKWIQLFCI
jgi:hypothetical protein